jgi:arsenate reductase-like glutaredoxin family protein
MNKHPVSIVQDRMEEKSNYFNMIAQRFISEGKYEDNLSAIELGLACLGIAEEAIKVFENRKNLVIDLGHKLTEYVGYELPLFIGHKKRGLPIPEALAEKCPKEITSLIEKATSRKHINDYGKELRQVSLTPDIFLAIHRSIVGARVETLLPDLLSDVERLGFTNVKEAFEKISPVYIQFLSAASLTKLLRKLSSGLRELKSKLEEEMKNIDLYSTRIREQLEGLYLETHQGLLDIIENDVVQGTDTSVITQKVSNLFSRLDRLFLGNVYHLKDYQRRKREILEDLRQEEGFKHYAEKRSMDISKPMREVYDEYLFMYKYGPLTKDENRNFMKQLTQELESFYRKKSRGVSQLKKFEKRGLISVDLDIDAMIDAYNSFVKGTVIPDIVGQCFLDLVSCLPPADDEAPRVVIDLANLKTVFLTGENILQVKEKSKEIPPEIAAYVSKYRKCVTILVYDIRGSSYMGIKLNDAVKEQRIKSKFAKEMAQVVKKYDGFLLKDTGDGGLLYIIISIPSRSRVKGPSSAIRYVQVGTLILYPRPMRHGVQYCARVTWC